MKRFAGLCLVVVLCTMLMSGCVGVNIFDNARNTTEDKQSKEEIAYEKWIEALPAGVYNPSDMSRRNPANVTKTFYHGAPFSLAMDTLGNPHVAFGHGEWKYEDIYYIKWNGDNWVCADGSIYDSRIIPNPANASRSIKGSTDHYLALDSHNNPHIIWKDKQFLATSETFNFTTDIIYIHWNGDDWICADGSEYNDEIKENNPAILNKANGDSHGAQIIIDSADRPHIVWWDYDYGDNEVIYIKWNGENWICADGTIFDRENTTDSNPANISRNIGDSRFPHLDLDSSDNPHVAWCDLSFGEEMEVLYIKWNGNDWVCADNAIYNPEDTSISNPANMSKNEGGSWHPFLVLDSQDNPHIAWQGHSFIGDGQACYVKRNGKNWVCADGSKYQPSAVPNSANVSRSLDDHINPYLALDSSNNPHIGWRDDSYWNEDDGASGAIYVKWNEDKWVSVDGNIYDPENLSFLNSENVSKSKLGSGLPRIVFDTSENPCVAWSNSNGGDGSNVFFVQWNGKNWIPLR
ncbi:MAG: hypothetical protein KAH30_06745 [Caldisericia bacterium]|nr:hypothetical protein [Caldisericia bacterium]